MTYDKAQSIARHHGCNLVMLPDGALQLLDNRAEPAGWNVINQIKRGEWSLADMRSALGY
jgi:hypothetical protein